MNINAPHLCECVMDRNEDISLKDVDDDYEWTNYSDDKEEKIVSHAFTRT